MKTVDEMRAGRVKLAQITEYLGKEACSFQNFEKKPLLQTTAKSRIANRRNCSEADIIHAFEHVAREKVEVLNSSTGFVSSRSSTSTVAFSTSSEQ